MSLEDTIAEFRSKLAEHNITFLLVCAKQSAGSFDTTIHSNSSQAGVRAILSALLRPLPQALAIIAQELESGARAALTMNQRVIDKARDDGSFLGAAQVLFERLRPYWTIVGWDTNNESARKPN